MAQTTIEWTATYRQDGTVLPGFTFNPWIGCTRVSPGCQHCYAETMMDKRYGKVKWGPQGTRVRTSADYWKQPLKWNREAAAEGIRRRVFCASLADVFEDKPDQNHQLNQWRDELWWLIEKTPNLDWLLLTKRPEVVSDAIPTRWKELGWPPNVWIGTSVENQEYADKRIPELLKIPAAVRFLSLEPLLGPIDLAPLIDNVFYNDEGNSTIGPSIDWIIVGGESGHNARPMHPAWVREIRDVCQDTGTAFHFKQWGEWSEKYPVDNAYLRRRGCVWTAPWDDGIQMWRVGKARAGRLLDGREWNEFPNMV